MTPDTLMAGVARSIITPPKGTYLVGYADRLRGCTGAHDDLYATALALSDGTTTLALVSCDLLCIHEDVVDRVRAAIAAQPLPQPLPWHSQERGTEPEVVICCSHTHAGPIVFAGPNASSATRMYIDSLVSRIAEAARNAVAEMAPARLEWAEGGARIGVNRRERAANGKVILGWNREGSADGSVGILRMTDAGGKLIATVVNYACHGTILPPQNRLVSADWIGAMRAKVERAVGGKMLFIQGAAGDINPDYEWGEGDPWEAVERLGGEVAEAVIRATPPPSPPPAPVPIRIARREVLLPFEPVSHQPSAISRGATQDRAAGQVLPSPPPAYRKKVLEFAGVPPFFSFLTDRLLNRLYPWRPRLEFRDGTWHVPMRLNAIRIGDAALMTFGAEVFTEIGLSVKAACPAKVKMFASVADGCIGYLPTAAAHDEGGYEVDDGPYLYRYPGRLARECETVATDATREAMTDLFRPPTTCV